MKGTGFDPQCPQSKNTLTFTAVLNHLYLQMHCTVALDEVLNCNTYLFMDLLMLNVPVCRGR